MFSRVTSRSNRRRARKSSPEPHPQLLSQEDSSTSRRRRHLDTDTYHPDEYEYADDDDDDDTRPCSHQHNNNTPTRTRRPPSQLPTFQAGNTCNKFLLGGQFHYPGKDKQRRHLYHRRRKTLWYRIFCSSPVRILSSVLLVSYVLVWHVLVPTTQVLLDYGRILSGGRYRSTHLFGNVEAVASSLPPLAQEKQQALRLQAARDRLQYGDAQRQEQRREIWQDIVPAWFHRNDKVEQLITTKDDDKSKRLRGQLVAHARSGKSGAKGRNREPVEISAGGVRATAMNDTAIDPVADMQQAKIPKTDNTTIHRGSVNATIQTPGTTIDGGVNVNATILSLPERVVEADKSIEERTLFNIDTRPLTSQCPPGLSDRDVLTTLVVQTSLERVWILHETCKRWKDPIVAVVHVSTAADGNEWMAIFGNATSACPQLTILQYEADLLEEGAGYPVNRLRNIGLDAVHTSHVLVADVDFVPSMHLHDTIRSTLLSQKNLLEPREAIVVPAFDRAPPEPCDASERCRKYLEDDSAFIPQSTDDLSSCISAKNCSVFQQSVNWEGHHSTRSESWLKGNWYDKKLDGSKGDRVGQIRRVKCFDSLRYEPYVVLRWCPPSTSEHTDMPPKPVAPYYDERFHGYGKNKIQLISHIRFMGYRFSILPKGFIVHHPHHESTAKHAWNNVEESDLHAAMDRLYPQFLRDVFNKYKATTTYIVDQCDRGRKNKDTKD